MTTVNVYLAFKGDREEADKLFNGLSADGNLVMPMNNTFWNSYFGMLDDKF